MSISHKLFNFFVSLSATEAVVKEQLTQKMIDASTRLLIEMSRDKILQHENDAWSAPLYDWLLSLLTTEHRKKAATLLVNIALFRNSLTDLCHVIKCFENQQSASWLTFEPSSLLQITKDANVSRKLFYLNSPKIAN